MTYVRRGSGEWLTNISVRWQDECLETFRTAKDVLEQAEARFRQYAPYASCGPHYAVCTPTSTPSHPSSASSSASSSAHHTPHTPVSPTPTAAVSWAGAGSSGDSAAGGAGKGWGITRVGSHGSVTPQAEGRGGGRGGQGKGKAKKGRGRESVQGEERKIEEGEPGVGSEHFQVMTTMRKALEELILACFDLSRGAPANLQPLALGSGGRAAGGMMEVAGGWGAARLVNKVTDHPLHVDMVETCNRLRAGEVRGLLVALASFQKPALMRRGAVKHCQILSNLLNCARALLCSAAAARSGGGGGDAGSGAGDLRRPDLRECLAIFLACQASVKEVRKAQGELGICKRYTLKAPEHELLSRLLHAGYWFVTAAPSAGRDAAAGGVKGTPRPDRAPWQGEGLEVEGRTTLLWASPSLMQNEEYARYGETLESFIQHLLQGSYGSEYLMADKGGSDETWHGHLVRLAGGRSAFAHVSEMWRSRHGRTLQLGSGCAMQVGAAGLAADGGEAVEGQEGSGGQGAADKSQDGVGGKVGGGQTEEEEGGLMLTITASSGWRLKTEMEEFEKALNHSAAGNQQVHLVLCDS